MHFAVTSRVISAMFAVSGLLAQAGAADWPEFRGPTGQGQATETGLPLRWSESLNVVWKVPVAGLGWSSPVIRGEKIWMTTATD